MILLGERVLHLANGAAGHQFVNGHLVLGTREHTHHQQSQTHDACHQRRMPPAEACGNHARERQLAPQSGHSHMDEDEQYYPPHPAEQHIDRQARREEVAHLAAIGFSHEHEHRWGERGVVIDKAVDIGQSCDVEDHIEQHFHPCPHLAWYESEQGREQVEVEEEFEKEVAVEACALSAWQRAEGAEHAQRVHEHEKPRIHAYGLGHINKKTLCQLQIFHHLKVSCYCFWWGDTAVFPILFPYHRLSPFTSSNPPLPYLA